MPKQTKLEKEDFILDFSEETPVKKKSGLRGLLKSPNGFKLKFRKKREYKKVMVIAHRGFSGVAPENTIASFKKAIEVNADMIELDVSLSKDNIPVVIHDQTVNRTTNGKGKVSEFTLSELKKLDAGSWFKPEFSEEKIPSLEEVIRLVKDKIMLNIEIKSYSVKKSSEQSGIEYQVVKLIEKYDIGSQVLISSFSKLAVKRIRELNPDIPVALLHRFTINKPLIKNYDNIGIYSFNQGKRFFSKKTMNLIHKTGIKLNLYTVNQEREMKKFVKFGVDGIITNYPDKLIQVMDELIKY